jgi:hypothetical protein
LHEKAQQEEVETRRNVCKSFFVTLDMNLTLRQNSKTRKKCLRKCVFVAKVVASPAALFVVAQTLRVLKAQRVLEKQRMNGEPCKAEWGTMR